MTSTPDQVIAQIREALEAGPTPGEWGSYVLPGSNTQGPTVGRVIGLPEIYRDRSSWLKPEDANFIAACNPQNIAVLLGEINDLQGVVHAMNEDFAGLKAERDALRKALEPLFARADKWQHNSDNARVSVKLGDLRRARTLSGDKS